MRDWEECYDGKSIISSWAARYRNILLHYMLRARKLKEIISENWNWISNKAFRKGMTNTVATSDLIHERCCTN